VEPIVAWHFTDPGCPWGYSSRPAIARLRWRFGDQIDWRLVLIGLSESGRRYEESGFTPARLATSWRKFQRRFGMPFGSGVKARLAGTSRACRAIIAAREEDPQLGYAALRALQLMNFTTTGLLDRDDDLLRALADVEGLDAEAIVNRIEDRRSSPPMRPTAPAPAPPPAPRPTPRVATPTATARSATRHPR
jgi:protein-disulfide isomerase-like protein with CxxC motif